MKASYQSLKKRQDGANNVMHPCTKAVRRTVRLSLGLTILPYSAHPQMNTYIQLEDHKTLIVL